MTSHSSEEDSHHSDSDAVVSEGDGGADGTVENNEESAAAGGDGDGDGGTGPVALNSKLLARKVRLVSCTSQFPTASAKLQPAIPAASRRNRFLEELQAS
jgi:hypothetical protein